MNELNSHLDLHKNLIIHSYPEMSNFHKKSFPGI